MKSFTKLRVGFNNTLYLITGNVVGQILSFVFTVYIAKKLGPSEFGVFNTVSAFVGMFSFLTFQGYQKVLIRECSGQIDKLQRITESIFFLKTFLSLIAVCAAFFSALFLNYNIQIIVYIAIYGFTLLFNNFSNILQVVFHANSEMKFIAYSGFLQRLIYIIPSTIVIYLEGGVKYLIIFLTISTMINVIINYYFAKKYFNFRLKINNLIKFVYNKKLFNQAFVFSFLGVIGYFYSKIDIVMISWFLDQRSVGIYSVGFKLIQPIEMFAMMASVAFFPMVVNRFKQNLPVKSQTLIYASIMLAILAIAISLLITLFAEKLILILFGTEYRESGLVLKYLCWVIPLTLITKPFVLSMQANHHERKIIFPNILRALSNITLNYFLILKYGMMGVVYSTILTYSWYFLIVNLGYQYFVLKRAGNIV
jgi:O-antigen/teichoic acid export membrane protein